MKKKITKKITLILMLISYLMVIICGVVKVPQRGKLKLGETTGEALALSADEKLFFDIPNKIELSKVYGIKLMIATYGQSINSGSLKIDVVDKSDDSIIMSTTFELVGTFDGEEKTVEFNDSCDDIEDTYLRITAGHENKQTIALWLDEDKKSTVKIEGKTKKGAVVCAFLCYNYEHIYVYEFIIVSLLLTAFYVLISFDKRKNKNVEKT